MGWQSRLVQEQRHAARLGCILGDLNELEPETAHQFRKQFRDVLQSEAGWQRGCLAISWAKGAYYSALRAAKLNESIQALQEARAEAERRWAAIRPISIRVQELHWTCCPRTGAHTATYIDCPCECHDDDDLDPPEQPVDIRDSDGWL